MKMAKMKRLGNSVTEGELFDKCYDLYKRNCKANNFILDEPSKCFTLTDVDGCYAEVELHNRYSGGPMYKAKIQVSEIGETFKIYPGRG